MHEETESARWDQLERWIEDEEDEHEHLHLALCSSDEAYEDSVRRWSLARIAAE